MRVIIGNGQIGSALSAILPDAIVLTRCEIDVSNTGDLLSNLHKKLDGYNIACIINCAAYTDVNKAEIEREIAMNVNCISVGILSKYCTERGIALVHYSTDFVFDGEKSTPYLEEDKCNPINYYGYTKYLGEQMVRDNNDKHFILRVSWVYSMLFKTNFIRKIIQSIESSNEIKVVCDQTGGPCMAHDISIATDALLNKLPVLYGTYHMSSPDFVSRYDLAQNAISLLEKYGIIGHQNIKLTQIYTDKEAVVKRPLNSMLDSTKLRNLGIQMDNWSHSLEQDIIRYAKHLQKN